MQRVLIYSILLLVGMGLSQLPSLPALSQLISTLTIIFLAYIMTQVGMEFDIDKSRLYQYAVDYLVAMGAAAIPWLFAAGYFWWVFGLGVNEALLVGRFAAPTSAGILFAMLAAAGLSATWVYRKARVLAIFDDLDTILLMIPLKMLLIGFVPKLLLLAVVILGLLAAAYFCIHWLRVPTNNAWVAVYAIAVWAAAYAFDYITDLHLEVLLPAFALGCIIKSDHLHGSAEFSPGGRPPREPEPRWERILDSGIKGGFMLLAGMALPPVHLSSMGLGAIVLHVVLITLLSNVGKCLPVTAYGKEATVRQRLALSLGMFPRGEVGIGVLLVSLDLFRQKGVLHMQGVQESITLAGLSLALNLALTGLFIIGVIRLLERPSIRKETTSR